MTPFKMLELIEFYEEVVDPKDPGLATVKRMLPQIVDFVESFMDLDDPNGFENWDKANRWLGFVQGIFYSRGDYTIDEMREHNRGE